MTTSQLPATTDINRDLAFWSIAVERHLGRLQTSAQGLSGEEARERVYCVYTQEKKESDLWKITKAPWAII